MTTMYVSQTTWKLLERFNFAKVQTLMQRLGWEWTFEDGKRVPTVEELRVHAAGLLEEVLRRKAGRVTASGFTATCSRKGALQLSFALEHAYQIKLDSATNPPYTQVAVQ